MSNVANLIRPSLRVARVVYFTDVTRANARVIPLGAFSEIVLPHVHGLALKARSNLNSAESELINPLMKDQLADPFAFFREQFNLAWKEARPGQAIDFLASRHTTALSVLAPRNIEEGSWWGRFMRARDDAVELKLSDAVDQEFADILKAYGDSATPKRKLIEVDDDRLAA